MLSGFSWPHTEMPALLVQIADFLPVTHFMSPVRNIVLMGIGFERASLLHSKTMLLLLGAGAFALSLAVFVWQVLRAEKRQKAGEEVQA